MTRQLLAFSRRQQLESRVLDLNAVVVNVERLLQRLIGEDVLLAVHPLPDAALVLADAGRIEQVLMNLALNARDAMSGGGSLTIAVGLVELTGQDPGAPADVAAGPFVTITVTDTGAGMTADTKAHLFEPFFTTKGPDHGTGLGLATAYGIVKQSGGEIQVASQPGAGATFTVFLPQLAGDVAVAAFPARPEVPGTVGETILLVEDEAAVRRLSRRILEARGYRVIEAVDGQDALERAASHVGPIDLLLTDVVMPLLGGRGLAERLWATRPALAVVYMSGYPDDELLHGTAHGRARFILKPFTADQLTAQLREALAGAAALGHPAGG